MPLPAGTGLDRRSFLSRSVGLALAVYGAAAARAACSSTTASPQALAAGPGDTVLVSIFMDGGADSLSLLFPTRRPALPPVAAARSRCPTPGPPFPEDAAPPLAPVGGGVRRRCTARASSRSSPPSATRAPTSRTSRRATTGRSARPTPGLRTGWLGRYLDRVGTQQQPAPGAQPRRRPRAVARDAPSTPVAALRGAGEYSFWSPGVWGQVENRMLEAVGQLGNGPRP